VSQLISLITGALVEEEEENACNEELTGAAAIHVMPRPINTVNWILVTTVVHFNDFLANNEGL